MYDNTFKLSQNFGPVPSSNFFGIRRNSCFAASCHLPSIVFAAKIVRVRFRGEKSLSTNPIGSSPVYLR